MKKIISFEAKFGWPETIALIALLVSFRSCYLIQESYTISLPKISVIETKGTAGPFYYRSQKKLVTFAYNSLTVTNTDGRAVPLLGLYPDEGTGMLASAVGKDVKLYQDKKIKVVLLDDYLTDVKDNSGLIEKYETKSFEELESLNLTLEPGKATRLNIGVLIETYEGKITKINTSLLSIVLKFSDGSTYIYRQGYETLPIKS